MTRFHFVEFKWVGVQKQYFYHVDLKLYFAMRDTTIFQII